MLFQVVYYLASTWILTIQVILQSFHQTHLSSSVIIILIYVDDLLLCGTHLTDLKDLQTILSHTFKMKDLGFIRYFLGIKVDTSENAFFVSQHKCNSYILKEYGMLNSKPLQLPMDIYLKLTHDNDDVLPNPTPYQRLLGKLIYLTITKPDITFTIQLLAQFMQQPTSVHMQAIKRLF